MYQNIEGVPVIMKASHVADVLGISKPHAYEVMEWSGFPLIRVGRSKRVQREDFFDWLKKQKQPV